MALTTVEERRFSLEKHNFKLLLQALSCFIFFTSCVLIALGVINATFIGPRSPEGSVLYEYPLVTEQTHGYCQRYTGVHIGIPGLIIGLVGLILIGLVVTRKLAFLLGVFQLVLCLIGFIILVIIVDLEVQACLNAQSEYLREHYINENVRRENYMKNAAWQVEKAKYELVHKQFPLAVYAVIGTNAAILVTAVLQIAAYILSALILLVGLAYSFMNSKREHEPVPLHEIEPGTIIRAQELKHLASPPENVDSYQYTRSVTYGKAPVPIR